MECSICCDDIKTETGQVTLACSHTFHLGCVGRWLMKSNTCPMCRGETCEQEKFHVEEEQEEEYEEEEYEIEFDNGGGESIVEEVPEFDAAVHALWVMRETFKMLEDGQSISSEGAAAPAPDMLWTWQEAYIDVGPVEQAWRRSMHQRAITNTTTGDERGYESM